MSYGYDLDGIRTEKTSVVKTYHTHVYTITETVAPTCGADGYTLETCTCGAERKTNVVAATGNHRYGSPTYTFPSCTEPIYALRTCSVCGAVEKTIYMEAPGHDWVEDEGGTSRTCTRCRKTESIGSLPPQPTDPPVQHDTVEEPEEK